MGTVEFDDDKVGIRKNKLTFKKDTWNRFNILDPSAEFGRIHYCKGYRFCTNYRGPTDRPAPPTYEGRCQYCEQLDKDAYDRFAVNVVSYLTDAMGNPLAEMNERTITITYWIFNSDRWQEIKMFKKTHGDLRKHDLLFHCTDESYQKGSLHCQPDAWWRMDDNFMKIVAAKYKEERTNLTKQLGRHVPYDKQGPDLVPDAPNGQQQGGRPAFNPQAVQGAVGGGASAPLFGASSGGAAVPDTSLDLLSVGASSPALVSTVQPPTAATPPPAAAPPVAAAVATPDVDDLDSMLDDMAT